MSSAYGKIPAPTTDAPLPLPIKDTLMTGEAVTVTLIPPNENTKTLEIYRGLLNGEIEAGNTYPQEFPLDMDGFREIGRVPKVGRLKGQDKLVDAIMFHYDFEE
ncbi:hypothetical protein HDV05_000598 [Chytridiales sp. JEL 0842]|nr:hypothetical protein HDV05_000598 [Chytridiales sp. JEL 0842]